MSTTPPEMGPPALSEHSLVGLLDETFSIYFRHFWRFAKLCAPVQLPSGIVSILLLELFHGPALTEAAAFVVAAFVGIFGAVFLFGAGATAVGQHYVTGDIVLLSCYQRAWWKVVSLAIIAIVAAFFLLVAPMAMLVKNETWIAGTAAVVLIPAFALLIYWSLAVQAVVVEGYSPMEALHRSTRLIKGNWWRIFGITVVLGLIATGLRLVAIIPFVVAASIVSTEPASNAAGSILALGGVIVGIFVLPVLFIAVTLVYYDVRVRKEHFDLTALSREMGLATT